MIERILRTPIMHRAVKSHGLVFLGGIAADDLSAGMYEQTKQVLRRVGDYLALAGSGRTQVVSATIFVTDLTLKSEMNRAWVEWFGTENLPARATVGAADLGEGVLIEVCVTAACAA